MNFTKRINLINFELNFIKRTDMKQKIFFTGVLFFMSIFQLSATQPHGKLGFSFSTLKNNRIVSSTEVERNFETIKSYRYLLFGLDYWYPISKSFTAETGLHYSFQPFDKKELDNSITSLDKHIVSIPMGLRFNFLKYGFLNGGILLDVGHFSGIGSYFGVGARVETLAGFGMYINPYVRTHALLPFNFNINSDRLVDLGIKIGVTYSLDNIYRRQQ